MKNETKLKQIWKCYGYDCHGHECNNKCICIIESHGYEELKYCPLAHTFIPNWKIIKEERRKNESNNSY